MDEFLCNSNSEIRLNFKRMIFCLPAFFEVRPWRLFAAIARADLRPYFSSNSRLRSRRCAAVVVFANVSIPP